LRYRTLHYNRKYHVPLVYTLRLRSNTYLVLEKKVLSGGGGNGAGRADRVPEPMHEALPELSGIGLVDLCRGGGEDRWITCRGACRVRVVAVPGVVVGAHPVVDIELQNPGTEAGGKREQGWG